MLLGGQSCPRASLPPSQSPAHSSYEVSRAKFQRQDPRDENPGLMQRMEDSGLRLIYDCRFGKCLPQFRRLTNMLIKVRNGALTHRDVKNEGTSGDVYENKGLATKCTHINTAFYTKMHELHGNERQSMGLFGRTCADHAINRSEVKGLQPGDLPKAGWLSACAGMTVEGGGEP